MAALTIYWINVDVELDEPLIVIGEDDKPTGARAAGAIMSFGVTAESESAAMSMVCDAIARIPQFAELVHEVTFDYVGEIEDVQTEIYADDDVASSLVQDPSRSGLWYRTGVGWYTD